MPSDLICADNSIWIRIMVDIDRRLAIEASGWFDAGVPMLAPGLLHYEFSHVLTRYTRNRRLSPTYANALLESLLALEIELIDDNDLHIQALKHSTAHPGLSGYDAHYLAVCERTGAELWTADKRLATFAEASDIAARLWVT
jgi:predicted nucleic acid-binding protein